MAPCCFKRSRGLSSSDCSKPLVARIATFFPWMSISVSFTTVSLAAQLVLITRVPCPKTIRRPRGAQIQPRAGPFSFLGAHVGEVTVEFASLGWPLPQCQDCVGGRRDNHGISTNRSSVGTYAGAVRASVGTEPPNRPGARSTSVTQTLVVVCVLSLAQSILARPCNPTNPPREGHNAASSNSHFDDSSH